MVCISTHRNIILLPHRLMSMYISVQITILLSKSYINLWCFAYKTWGNKKQYLKTIEDFLAIFRNHPCAELIYWKEDSFDASTFISAAIESKLRVFDSPYTIYSRNYLWESATIFYSLCNKIFSWSKTISR